MDRDRDDSCSSLDVPVDLLLGAAEAVRDHHDYAKRRRSGSDRENNGSHQPDGLSPPPTTKKKSKVLMATKQVLASKSPGRGLGRGRQLRDPEGGTYISARSRARKAPLPMKLRALPASFWEQPNLNKGPSPGTIFSALPPLGPLGPLCKDDGPDPDGARDALRGANPARGPEPGCDSGVQTQGANGNGLVTHSPADTDLLFSLFRSVEPKTTLHRRTRGRPRRPAPAPGSGGGPRGGEQRDDDPCLLGSLTSSLTSSLSLACRQMDGLDRGVSALRAGVGGASVGVDNNNFAQILSDLVVKL